jgi:hypothetical protein
MTPVSVFFDTGGTRNIRRTGRPAQGGLEVELQEAQGSMQGGNTFVFFMVTLP